MNSAVKQWERNGKYFNFEGKNIFYLQEGNGEDLLIIHGYPYNSFEWMGAQRHIKVLGIFARLSHRDGKHGYLNDMPLVMHYLRKVCERYVELRPMLRLLDALEGKVPRPKYVV